MCSRTACVTDSIFSVLLALVKRTLQRACFHSQDPAALLLLLPLLMLSALLLVVLLVLLPPLFCSLLHAQLQSALLLLKILLLSGLLLLLLFLMSALLLMLLMSTACIDSRCRRTPIWMYIYISCSSDNGSLLAVAHANSCSYTSNGCC